MQYLFLYVLCVILFNQTLRSGLNRKTHIIVPVAFNYLSGSLIIAVLVFSRVIYKDISWSTPVLAVGLVNGILYVVHLLIILEAYRFAGVGITSAISGTGVVLPTLISWWIWGEPMTLYRWAAILLIAPAMFLMRPDTKIKSRIPLYGSLILFLCFFFLGIILTLHKYVQVNTVTSAHGIYQIVLFTCALVCSFAYVFLRGFKFKSRDILLGGFAGISNSLALLMVLLCLAVIPAVIFYPSSGCLVILLNVVISRFLWGEKLIKRQIAGILIGIAIVVLTNISHIS
jgi:drug/metabolite transporter (DMT)-like permease